MKVCFFVWVLHFRDLWATCPELKKILTYIVDKNIGADMSYEASALSFSIRLVFIIMEASKILNITYHDFFHNRNDLTINHVSEPAADHTYICFYIVHFLRITSSAIVFLNSSINMDGRLFYVQISYFHDIFQINCFIIW